MTQAPPPHHHPLANDGPGLLDYIHQAYLRWRDWPPEKRWLHTQHIDPERFPELERLAVKTIWEEGEK